MTIATDNNITFTFELDNYHLTVEVRNDTVVIVAFEKSDNSFTSFAFESKGIITFVLGDHTGYLAGEKPLDSSNET